MCGEWNLGDRSTRIESRKPINSDSRAIRQTKPVNGSKDEFTFGSTIMVLSER
jgi:hypothetical protein